MSDTLRETATVPEALLRPLLESAGESLKELDAEEVPPLLRALTGFDRRGLTSSPARQQLRKAFDADQAFRERSIEHFLERPEVRAVAERWVPHEGAAQVAEAAEREDLPLLASTLYALRPEGWEFGLGVACGAHSRSRHLRAEDADHQALQDRIKDLEEAHRRAQAAQATARAATETTERELRDERRSRRARETEAERHAEAAERRAQEHARALDHARQDVEAAELRRRQAAERTQRVEAELRTTRAELATARRELVEAGRQLEDATVRSTGLRPDDVRALVDAAELARKLADGLAGVAAQARARGFVRTPSPSTTSTPAAPLESGRSSPGATARETKPKVRTRRVALRVPPGLVAESPEAIDAMLRTPGVAVVLDGYNVSMAAWPDLGTADQRDRLVAALAQLALRTRAEVTVVFDGADVGAVRPPRRPGLRVVFSSADEKADPVVVRAVAAMGLETPVVAVSSDHWVREHAQAEGAFVVGSRAFLGALRG